MFTIKNNNIDFNCYPANFHGLNQSAFICTKNNEKNVEGFENTLSGIQSGKLIAWFDGNDVNGNGSEVAEGTTFRVWKDKSGLGNDAVNNWNQGPVVKANTRNGLSTVDLRARTKMNFNFPDVDSYSLFTVQLAKSDGAVNADWQRLIQSHGQNNDPNNNRDGFLFYGTHRYSDFFHTMVGCNNFGNWDKYGPMRTSMFADWSYSDLIVNANDKTTSSSINGEIGPTRSYPDIGSACGNNFNIINAMSIGATNNGSQQWFGSVAEIILFKGVINDADRKTVQNYLKDKWKLTPNPPEADTTNAPKIFIAGGDNSIIAYSTNGTDWSKASLPDGYNTQVHSIAYDGKIMVAGAWCGDNTGLMYSRDGKKWIGVKGNYAWKAVSNVAYCKDQFVACVQLSNNNHWWLATSFDGINWQDMWQPSNIIQDARVIVRCVYGAGVFVILLQSGNDYYMAYSEDMMGWRECGGTRRAFNDGFSLAYNGKIFVAVGTGECRFLYSTDGKNWERSESGNSQSNGIGRGVTWGNNLWVATFSNGNTPVLTSEDGKNWKFSQASRDTFEHAMYSTWTGDKWLIAGNGRCKLASTTDFNSYNRIDVPFGTQILTIATATKYVKSYPVIKCEDGFSQIGSSCYPDSLVNRK